MRKILMTTVCLVAFAGPAFSNSDEYTPKKSDLTSLRAAERWCARHPDAMESGAEDEHLISLRECALKIWPPIKDVDADHVDDPKLAAISCGWVVKANRVRGADDAKTNKSVDYLEAFRDGGK